jgi:hypothetical protein
MRGSFLDNEKKKEFEEILAKAIAAMPSSSSTSPVNK